jgi:hypothetical protein
VDDFWAYWVLLVIAIAGFMLWRGVRKTLAPQRKRELGTEAVDLAYLQRELANQAAAHPRQNYHWANPKGLDVNPEMSVDDATYARRYHAAHGKPEKTR